MPPQVPPAFRFIKMLFLREVSNPRKLFYRELGQKRENLGRIPAVLCDREIANVDMLSF